MKQGSLVFIVLNCIALIRGQSCTEGTIRNCRTSSGYDQFLLGNNINPEGDSEDNRQNKILTLGGQAVRDFCSFALEYRSCLLDNVIDRCFGVNEGVVQGAINNIRYVCIDTFEEYVNEIQPCVSDAALRSRIAGCTNLVSSYPSSQDEACDDINDLVACMTDEVTDECGEDAGDWWLELQKTTLQPTADVIFCRISIERSGSGGNPTRRPWVPGPNDIPTRRPFVPGSNGNRQDSDSSENSGVWLSASILPILTASSLLLWSCF